MTKITNEKKIFDKMINLKNVSIYKKVMGIIWCICALIIFEVLLNDEPFAIESRVFWYYYIWTIPFFCIFQDWEFVNVMCSNRRWLWALPYVINTCFIILTLLARGSMLETDFGLPPLVRECCGTFFWIMSIPLTIIHDKKVWTIYAVAVYVNSIIYYWVLMSANNHLINSHIYLLVNIVIVLIAYVISMSITYYNFRRIISWSVATK